MDFLIMPRFVNGVDMAPVGSRMTAGTYLQHIEYAQQDGVVLVTDAKEDEVLDRPDVAAVITKMAVADEFVKLQADMKAGKLTTNAQIGAAFALASSAVDALAVAPVSEEPVGK